MSLIYWSASSPDNDASHHSASAQRFFRLYHDFYSTVRSLFVQIGSRFVKLATVGLSLFAVRSSQAGLIETIEEAGRQTSSAKNIATINFNDASTGYHNTETFNTGTLSVTYTGDQYINRADLYGGAFDPSTGKNSNYFAVNSGDVTVDLSNPQAYFGLWLSAADKFNQIAFYNGDKEVGALTGISDSLASLPKSYDGNPTDQFLGKDSEEKFAFINFYAQTQEDEFNKIILTNTPGGGTVFESDNHTFSDMLQAPASSGTPLDNKSTDDNSTDNNSTDNKTTDDNSTEGNSTDNNSTGASSLNQPSSNSPVAVPEPSTFALLGLGGLGLLIRSIRRRRNVIK